MRERQGTLTGVDGTQLNWRAWLPNGLARAAVVLVHGFGEHTGRHPALSAHLVPRGYAIWGFDLRGHGRSSGLRGHIMAWEEYRGDMDRFLALARAEEQGVPLFLYGHSLGGLIVLEYAADHPEGLAGVIALAPGLSMDLPLIQRWMVRVASRVRPTLGREQPADPQDPLMHGRSSARLVTEMRRAMARSDAAAPGMRLPLLILHGTADPLIAPEVSRAFYERVGSPDKTLLEYAGAGHHPHNETSAESLMRDVADWLDRQLAKQGTV